MRTKQNKGKKKGDLKDENRKGILRKAKKGRFQGRNQGEKGKLRKQKTREDENLRTTTRRESKFIKCH